MMKHQYICFASAILPNLYGYNRHFHFDLKFPELTLQTAILGMFNDSVSNIHLINHILLFKLYIYKSRNKHRLNIQELLANILNIKKLEKVTAFGNVKKVAAYDKKWDITNRKRYRVKLGLQPVFNLQTKGLEGWFYF